MPESIAVFGGADIVKLHDVSQPADGGADIHPQRIIDQLAGVQILILDPYPLRQFGEAAAIFRHPEAANITYLGLYALQHRGQDSAGILTYDNTSREFHLEKRKGLVSSVFDKGTLEELKGNLSIGHTRYVTVGSDHKSNIQPMVTGIPFGIGMVHNGNILNFYSIKRILREETGSHLLSNNDIELILNLWCHHMINMGTRGFELDIAVKALKSKFGRDTFLIDAYIYDSVEDKKMYYISTAEFDKRQKAGEFLEWAKVHGDYYGTHKQETIKLLEKNPVLFNIDVQGAEQLIKEFPNNCITIFLLPENYEQMVDHIKNRGEMTEGDFRARLKSAEIELKKKDKFQYQIVNSEGKLTETIDKIAQIIQNRLGTVKMVDKNKKKG